MSDIVKRLRDPSSGSPRWLDTMQEAAATIESLRAEVEALRHSCDVLARQRARLDIALAEARAERDMADGARGLGDRGA